MTSPSVRSISIAAPAAEVHAYLAEPASLPDWAPGFASSARAADGGLWEIVVPSGHPGKLLARLDADAGTVDLLDPRTRSLGAYLRVAPDGAGSVLSMSVNLGADASQDAVQAQMAVVETELETIQARCEGRAA